MVTRTLTAADFEAVFAAFADAFSDYVVKLSPTREQLTEMLTRRGYVAEASVATFDGERIVAFTLNGVEGNRAYDSGTGVVPSHRRRGLARAIMDASTAVLRERGCTEYVLEVIEQNVAAHRLYQDLGFVETRRLQCWTFAPDATAASVPATSATFDSSWWDVQPSWQNSPASIARARDEHIVLGDDDGYAVVFPSNGDLPQLAVSRESRRQGVGTRLLHAAATIAGKPLRIVNVDERDAGITRFLERAGAVRTVRQVEMLRVF